MKICICSMTFADEVLEISKMLEAAGHEVLLPNGIINRLAERPDFDPIRAKIDTDSNRLHAEKIRECDIVLMCNFLKNCTPGYIGANCFAELYLANYFEKPIFALFPLPDINYINDEIRSFNITVLNGELKLIPSSSDTPNSNVVDNPPSPIEPSGNPRPASSEPVSKPADPSALPPNPQITLSTAPIAPITSSSVPEAEPVHCEVPESNHQNPLQRMRDNWFSLWDKQKDGEA